MQCGTERTVKRGVVRGRARIVQSDANVKPLLGFVLHCIKSVQSRTIDTPKFYAVLFGIVCARFCQTPPTPSHPYPLVIIIHSHTEKFVLDFLLDPAKLLSDPPCWITVLLSSAGSSLGNIWGSHAYDIIIIIFR